MRELNHAALIKRSCVLGDIRRRRGRADDMGQSRTVGCARNMTHPLTEQTRQPRQPGEQSGLEDAAERSQTFFQEMHFILDNEARERIEEYFRTVRKRGRNTLISGWRRRTCRRAAWHMQQAARTAFDPSRQPKHSGDPIDGGRALAEQSELVDRSQKYRRGVTINVAVREQEWQRFASASLLKSGSTRNDRSDTRYRADGVAPERGAIPFRYPIRRRDRPAACSRRSWPRHIRGQSFPGLPARRPRSAPGADSTPAHNATRQRDRQTASPLHWACSCRPPKSQSRKGFLRLVRFGGLSLRVPKAAPVAAPVVPSADAAGSASSR